MSKLERRTKTLVIRPLKSNDYQSWMKGNTELPAARNQWDREPSPPSEVSRIGFNRLLKKQKKWREEDKYYIFPVFEKKSNQLVGSLGIVDLARGYTHTASISYSIFNPYWGRGYGKEAVTALIDIGFRDLNLHRLEAGIEPTNRRSILLVRSLGFRKEGLKRKFVYLRGNWKDLVSYAITCDDLGLEWNGKLHT
jgi:ribosomal-protein-alanine N-acetyltransferase